MDPELRVAFEALTKDASVWDGVGDALSAAQSEVAAIEVNRGAFSFAAIDLADSYAQLHTTVAGLLRDGAEATHAGADALRTVRDDFSRYEDIAQSELYALWQPIA
ncbi:MAG: hypothetical protein J0I43_08570 [Microbacterium sp.]|uniref:hypothetical protein n=1 Tax=Microbacterium sp. TaxID=51671 RepID=UPI001AC832F4|nr:hypothetical protein [Microbacterium sp.]MBN9177401.1 hypothetical protein [Microbacterium sp.]